MREDARFIKGVPHKESKKRQSLKVPLSVKRERVNAEVLFFDTRPHLEIIAITVITALVRGARGEPDHPDCGVPAPRSIISRNV